MHRRVSALLLSGPWDHSLCSRPPCSPESCRALAGPAALAAAAASGTGALAAGRHAGLHGGPGGSAEASPTPSSSGKWRGWRQGRAGAGSSVASSPSSPPPALPPQLTSLPMPYLLRRVPPPPNLLTRARATPCQRPCIHSAPRGTARAAERHVCLLSCVCVPTRRRQACGPTHSHIPAVHRRHKRACAQVDEPPQGVPRVSSAQSAQSAQSAGSGEAADGAASTSAAADARVCSACPRGLVGDVWGRQGAQRALPHYKCSLCRHGCGVTGGVARGVCSLRLQRVRAVLTRAAAAQRPSGRPHLPASVVYRVSCEHFSQPLLEARDPIPYRILHALPYPVLPRCRPPGSQDPCLISWRPRRPRRARLPACAAAELPQHACAGLAVAGPTLPLLRQGQPVLQGADSGGAATLHDPIRTAGRLRERDDAIQAARCERPGVATGRPGQARWQRSRPRCPRASHAARQPTLPARWTRKALLIARCWQGREEATG